MELKINKLTPVYREKSVTGNFIQWTIEDATDSIVSVKVERAGSPEGPFNLLVDNIQTFNFFDSNDSVPSPDEDETLAQFQLYSLRRNVYYRVTAITEAGDELQDTAPVLNSLPKRESLLRKKIHRDITFSFKFNGVPLAIMKKKHWGIRCTSCFDPLTKKVTNSKCETCYGTGFEGGYFDPVHITGRLSVDNVQVQLSNNGYTETGKKRGTILDYPLVEPHDIVIESNNNARYFVQHSTQTELKTVPVHQRLLLSELAKDSVEYKVSVDNSTTPAIY